MQLSATSRPPDTHQKTFFSSQAAADLVDTGSPELKEKQLHGASERMFPEQSLALVSLKTKESFTSSV